MQVRRGGRRQHAVIRHEMRSRSRNESSQAFEEDERLEHDMRAAIAPRAAEAVEDVAGPREREPLGGDGGAGDLPAEALEPIALAGRDADASVEREAIDAGAELSRDEAHLAPGPLGIARRAVREGFHGFREHPIQHRRIVEVEVHAAEKNGNGAQRAASRARGRCAQLRCARIPFRAARGSRGAFIKPELGAARRRSSARRSA